jgi:hypothetical protein
MSKQILPDYIVRQDVVQAKVEEAKAMIESANNHLEALKKEDIPTQLEVLKNILKSDEAFKGWLDKAEKSYIGKLGFIPKEERERVHQSFIDVLNRTATPRNGLQGFIYNRNGYKVEQDADGKLYFDLQQIESEATEKAKKYFTDEDKEYFSHLQDVVEAYHKLQSYEKAHDYVPFSRNTESFMRNLMSGFSPYWFTISWEVGKMSKQGKQIMEELEDE